MGEPTTPAPVAASQRRLKVALQLFGVVIAGCAAYYGTLYAWGWFHEARPSDRETAEACLDIPPEELDIGKVWETTSYEQVIHIANVTNQPVTITRFEKSCDCLAITPNESVTLAAQERRAFTLKLSLVSRQPFVRSTEGEPFVVRFGARYSTDGRPHDQELTWKLMARVIPTIRLRPFQLDLGTVSERQVPPARTVTIEANDRIERVDAIAPPGWAVEIARGQSASSSNPFVAALRAAPGRELGRISDAVQLYPVDRDGKRLSAKELKITGEVVRDVMANPREVRHGRQRCGTTVTEAVRLASLTNRPFSVKRAGSKCADLKVSRIPDSDAERLYSLELVCTAPGEQRVTAEFVVRDDNGMEFELAVPIRYCGFQDSR